MADFSDKVSNKAEDLGGKAKEGIGEATGNDSLADEGRADQVKSEIKEAVHEAGDKVKEVADKVLGAFKKDDDKPHTGDVN
ncbi:CsbD family protein [Corynebacterium pacaense]|uniref:CsbD family protein n=1 Tax=Corynebacterium pacaense TaxID=1816684 RepID=UPI0009BA05FA|nr:CsbD family protein [Corynebacterium pacaense]